MYASGLGAQVSPLNPYLLEHYSKLRGKELKEAMDSIESSISNNKVVIESLKKASESADEEKKKELKEFLDFLKK